jgi:adenosylcobinamide kinase/adenosylcobinamide-phosphate guanylyltransferase
MFWGLAGFAVFTLAPGLGLPPELPAMPAADLLARQVWWIGTAAATAIGLADLPAQDAGSGRARIGRADRAAAHHRRAAAGDHTTPVPENLHHSFVVAVHGDQPRLLGGSRLAVGGLVGRASRSRSRQRARALPEGRLTFVLGGARSGKSRTPRRWSHGPPAPWTYIATAQAYDDEMPSASPIHRARRGEGWETVDAPLDLAAALAAMPDGRPVLVDCLTLWLSNLMLAEHDVDRFRRCDGSPRCWRRAGPWFVVSNEVGLGIVPDNALARRFRDAQGRLNQRWRRWPTRCVHGRRPADEGEMMTRSTTRTPSATRQDGQAQGRAGRRGRRQDDRKGPADRQHRSGQGQVHGRLRPGAADARLRPAVGVVQFVKGAWHRREGCARAFGDRVVWHTMGEGFTWETQDLARDIAAPGAPGRRRWN